MKKSLLAPLTNFDKKHYRKLSEPSDAEDVKLKGSDKVVASI